MNAYFAKRSVLVVGALLLAALLWGMLLTGTASAQGTPGAMGNPGSSHMGHGPGATMWMTGTTGMMGGYGMGPGTMGTHGMGTMAPMAGMMGGHGMGPGTMGSHMGYGPGATMWMTCLLYTSPSTRD